MDKQKILKLVDHTLLSQSATWEEIRAILGTSRLVKLMKQTAADNGY